MDNSGTLESYLFLLSSQNEVISFSIKDLACSFAKKVISELNTTCRCSASYLDIERNNAQQCILFYYKI